eukprot:scaffold694_cov338-Pavlova_lutheri.AAC.38
MWCQKTRKHSFRRSRDMVWKDGRAKPGWSSSHMHDALLWIPPAPITSKRGGGPTNYKSARRFPLGTRHAHATDSQPGSICQTAIQGLDSWEAGRGHVLVHDPRIRPSDPSSRKQGRCPGLNGGHRVSVGQRSGRPGVGVGSEWGESIRFEWMGSVSICLNRAGGGTDRSTTRRERPWTIETVETLDSNDPGVERSLT